MTQIDQGWLPCFIFGWRWRHRKFWHVWQSAAALPNGMSAEIPSPSTKIGISVTSSINLSSLNSWSTANTICYLIFVAFVRIEAIEPNYGPKLLAEVEGKKRRRHFGVRLKVLSRRTWISKRSFGDLIKIYLELVYDNVKCMKTGKTANLPWTKPAEISKLKVVQLKNDGRHSTEKSVSHGILIGVVDWR